MTSTPEHPDKVLTELQWKHYRELRLAGTTNIQEAFLAGKLTAYGVENLDTDWMNGLTSPDVMSPVLQHQALKAEAQACKACDLCSTRKQAVIGHGSLRAPIMVVGEAPGADEDDKGVPFIGKAGQAFFGDGQQVAGLLSKAGLSRADCYVTNTIKCRPPGNAQPSPHQVDMCRQFLEREIALVRPLLLLSLGISSTRFLLGGLYGVHYTDWVNAKMKDMRAFNRAQSLPTWQGIPIISTYHPAAYLRDVAMYGPLIEEDMLVLKAVHDHLKKVTTP